VASATAAAGSAILQLRHWTEYAGAYVDASRFLDNLECKRVHDKGKVVHLIFRVVIMGLIQSQAHAGPPSTVAAEEYAYSLILAQFRFEIVASFVFHSKHASPLEQNFLDNQPVRIIFIYSHIVNPTKKKTFATIPIRHKCRDNLPLLALHGITSTIIWQSSSYKKRDGITGNYF
jgi:hypothetical protein